MSIEPDRQSAESLVMQLMGTPGGPTQESDVAALIVERLGAAGVTPNCIAFDSAHQRSARGGETGNLIVKLPGTAGRTREPRRMLMAHMDTVPLCVGCKPEKLGNRVVPASSETALGADDRAGCATVLTAIETILKHDLPHPPLTLLWTVQEEIGLHGARNVARSKLGGPAMAFNFDGGEPYKLVTGATGAYRMKIHVTGIAAHAGVHPERGVSAAVIASKAIAKLDDEGWHGLIQKGRYTGTSNVGVLQGGAASNVVMDRLLLHAEARSHHPQFRKRIVGAFQRAFDEAVKSEHNDSDRRGDVRFEINHEYDSFRLKSTEPCVVEAKRVIRDLGMAPETKVTNGGLDANWMNAHGVLTVTLGCGQHNIHTVNEYLDLEEFHTACRVAVRLACGVT